MAKIYAPNKEYTGVSASVAFVKGVGEASDPNLIVWFKDHGYKVEEEEEVKQHGEPKQIQDMSLEELKTYAKKKEISLTGLTKKDDIIERINEVEAGN